MKNIKKIAKEILSESLNSKHYPKQIGKWKLIEQNENSIIYEKKKDHLSNVKLQMHLDMEVTPGNDIEYVVRERHQYSGLAYENLDSAYKAFIKRLKSE